MELAFRRISPKSTPSEHNTYLVENARLHCLFHPFTGFDLSGRGQSMKKWLPRGA